MWRDLRLGDKIRIVRIPALLDEPRYHNGDWEDTLELYRTLIASNLVLTISEIDEFGRPWIEHETRDEDGTEHSHSLAMDDNSWVRVN